jgi:membrane peptidoglycan carboxypeptidase
MRSGGLLKLLGLCMVTGVLLAGLMMPFVFGAATVVHATGNTLLSGATTFATRDMPEVSTITDRNGAPIAYVYGKDPAGTDVYRVNTPEQQISTTMKTAITAVEDKRFYEHSAVDWEGTLRAVLKDVSSDAATQGASTITQQYVKNYTEYVAAQNRSEAENATETTVARKLREARVAYALEHTMSKDQILTAYLNVVPFGNQSFGVGAAAQTYFGTTPDKLTIAQAALLAALVNQPGALNPNTNPKDALQRRNLVIDLMADPHNSLHISDAQADEAKREPLGTVSPLGRPPDGCVGAGDSATNGFFCAYVMDYLAKAGFTGQQWNTGGYTIRTTLDPKDTAAAQAAARAQVPTRTPGIANAMAVIEPGKTAHKVRALVANRDFGDDASKGQTAYDIVSRVQPFGAGSTYKIFTAAAAIQQGMNIDTMLDAPPMYTSPIYKTGAVPYTVGNAAGVQPGPRTLQMALATSPNTTFVALEERVGLSNVVDMASRLGLRQGMNDVNASGQSLKADGSNGPSLAESVTRRNIGAFTLGYTPTSVLELSNVAATIVSDGVYCPPDPIEGAQDRHGNKVPIKQSPCEQAVPPPVADQLAQGLSKDASDGTSKAAADSFGWTRPLIAKTGTTEDSKSAAFVGATPQMAAAVLTYADGDHPQGICDSTGSAPPHLCGANGNIYGGKVPARTWYEAMMQILGGLPAVALPGVPLPPPGPPPPPPPPPGLPPPGLPVPPTGLPLPTVPPPRASSPPAPPSPAPTSPRRTKPPNL